MHNRQIMGNEKIGKPHFLLQPFHEVQDLRLHGHIQSRCGFVRDDETGIGTQCQGDDHSLPHTSRELVRVVIHSLLRRGYATSLSSFAARAFALVRDTSMCVVMVCTN